MKHYYGGPKEAPPSLGFVRRVHLDVQYIENLGKSEDLYAMSK